MALPKKPSSAPGDARKPQALARPADGPAGEILLYRTEDGQTRVECRFAEESLWLSQAAMAELFQTSKQNIAKHLKAIFAEGELSRDSVVNSWLTTAADGKRYRVEHYNLDAILARLSVEMLPAAHGAAELCQVGFLRTGGRGVARGRR